MFESISNEFKKSPMSALSGVVGIIVAPLSLMLAWLQFEDSSSKLTTLSTSDSVQEASINVGNTLLVMAFFISITVGSAIIIRMLSRKHDLAALFVSIPLASVANFLTMLTIYLTPPRPIDNNLFVSANDLALYASVTIYLVFCGKAILADLFSSSQQKTDDSKGCDKEDDVKTVLVVALFILFVWSKLVFTGQELLSETFLPEIAHPTVVEPSKTNA
jgi:hypothetical protein